MYVYYSDRSTFCLHLTHSLLSMENQKVNHTAPKETISKFMWTCLCFFFLCSAPISLACKHSWPFIFFHIKKPISEILEVPFFWRNGRSGVQVARAKKNNAQGLGTLLFMILLTYLFYVTTWQCTKNVSLMTKTLHNMFDWSFMRWYFYEQTTSAYSVHKTERGGNKKCILTVTYI